MEYRDHDCWTVITRDRQPSAQFEHTVGVTETGLGRYDDKLKKNEVAILKTPGVEDLEPTAFSGDGGLTLLERAPLVLT